MVERVGAEELLTACPDCTQVLKGDLPGIRIRSMWELLAEDWKPPRRHTGVTATLHDPCKVRDEPAVREAVRRLLEASGCTLEELEYAGENSRCCGWGGRIPAVDADLSRRIARRRGDESGLPMITYCATCRMALRDVGKDAVHLVDFLLSADPEEAMQRSYPGGPIRYANRLRTKWSLRRLRPFGSD
jgi:Fe-S oxidoreductase